MGQTIANTSSVAFVAKQLRKQFGDVVAVRDLDLSIAAGELTVLIGPNGAGKTTFLRMLCGVLKPTQGLLLVEGRTGVARQHFSRWHVGYCPQALVVWPDLTCLEQLVLLGQMYNLSRVQARTRAREVLASLALATSEDTLACQLSGGMQRRLNIALALMHNPDFLVLDEPSAGLDPQGRALIRDLLRSWVCQHHKTVLVSTHDMGEAERISDRILLMDHGQIIAEGTPEELRTVGRRKGVLELRLPIKDASAYTPLVSSLTARFPGAHVGNHVIVIGTDEPDHDRQKVVEQLRTCGLDPAAVTITTRRYCLEDLFLETTGRHLRA